jgi:AhpD family alkylhydroperoxidase
MPRITGVPTRDAGVLLRVLYWFSRKRFGAVMEPITVAAHHPKILRANLRHEVAVERAAKKLPVSVRELAQYRVAQQVQCSWCIDFGTMLQKHEGLDIDRLRKIDDYATAPEYTRPERLALAYADAMTATPTTVTDEQVTELVAEFGKAGVIELSYLISLENARGRFNSALGITDQGFTSGDACKIPVPSDVEVTRERA